MNDSDVRPTTHQGDLAKLPPALAPLIERPQWAVWRWTQSENGRWQKPPFMAMQPERHASTRDASTWSDYATALDVLRNGKADGISYVLTEDDPFAAIDLDHCRDIDTCSIDVWAQNFLEAGRASYSEVTPSGAGCRIWGLADGAMLNKKFTLNIDGKDVAAELFRRTNKTLTITGYRLDTITKLTNIDRVIDWAVIWGERRKAAAAEAAVPINCNGFNGNGSGYGIDQIEQIVRTGAPDGKNRSDVFHTIVGHYLGCGWSAEQILEHLQQFPDGIGSRYLREDRLRNEIARSAGKHAKPELPVPVTLCWRAWVRRNSAAASPIQGWRCASIAVAGRGRNIPSRCASSRRRSRMRMGSRSPRWWWTGSLFRLAGMHSRNRIPGGNVTGRISRRP